MHLLVAASDLLPLPPGGIEIAHFVRLSCAFHGMRMKGASGHEMRMKWDAHSLNLKGASYEHDTSMRMMRCTSYAPAMRAGGGFMVEHILVAVELRTCDAPTMHLLCACYTDHLLCRPPAMQATCYQVLLSGHHCTCCLLAAAASYVYL